MKKRILILSFCVLSISSYPLSANAQWAKSYSLTLPRRAQIASNASDNYFYFVGGINNSWALIKSDQLGNIVWSKLSDAFFVVEKTNDGGCITGIFNTVLKLDSNGVVQWHKIYAGSIKSIKQTADGGYIFAFRDSLGPIILVKTTSAGNATWSKIITHDFSYGDDELSVTQSLDGGYFVLDGSIDSWLIKVTSRGRLSWAKQIDNGDNYAMSTGLASLSDGGCAITSANIWSAEGTKTTIIRINSKGKLLWKKSYSNNLQNNQALSILEIADHSLLISGMLGLYAGEPVQDWAMKIDANGNIIWQYVYGGFGWAWSIKQLPNTSLLLIGSLNSVAPDDIKLVNMNIDGNIPDCPLIKPSNVSITTDNVNVISGTVNIVNYPIQDLNYNTPIENVTILFSPVCN